MDSEFEENSEIFDGEENQGEAEDSLDSTDGQDDDGNLVNNPNFRKWQSSTEKKHAEQINALMGQMAQFQRDLQNKEMTIAQLTASKTAITNAMEALGGDDTKAMVIMAQRNAEMEAELAVRRQRDEQYETQETERQQWAAWRAREEADAREMGFNPKDPIFQQALDDAQRIRDLKPIKVAIATMAKRGKSAGQNEMPDSEPEGRRVPQVGAPPPSGGANVSRTRGARLEQLKKERQQAMSNRGTRSYREVREEYAAKARALGIDPRDIEPG